MFKSDLHTHLVDDDDADETVQLVCDLSGEPLWRLCRSGRLVPVSTPRLRPADSVSEAREKEAR